MNPTQVKNKAAIEKWRRVFEVTRDRLAKLRKDQFPVFSRVWVDCKNRYQGPALVSPCQPDNVAYLEVQNPNGNHWQYPIEDCTPTHAGRHAYDPNHGTCEKCGERTKFTVKVEDRWANWCGCGN